MPLGAATGEEFVVKLDVVVYPPGGEDQPGSIHTVWWGHADDGAA
jgi:hypothetical protein